MKKVLYLALALVLSLTAVLKVNAATEADLIAKAKEVQTIGGKKIKVKDNVVTQLERYLNKYEVSEADCDTILTAVNSAIDKAKAAGATEWGMLTTAQKQEMITLATSVTDNTSVKGTLTMDGTLTIYESDGSVFTKLDDIVEEVTDEESGTKPSNTGLTSPATIIIGGVALIGLLVVTRKVVKANA